MLNTTRDQLARIASTLAPIALALVAVALATYSTLSYEPLKAYIDSLSGDGRAETFTPRLFASLVVSTRIAAVMLALAAAGLWMARPHVARALTVVATSTLDYVRDTLRAAIRTLQHESAGHLAALLGIVTLAFVLRIRVLWQPMGYDESYTYIEYVSRPWLIAWANYSEPNNHLLHTLLAHLTTRVFGNAVWAIRLPAFIAGCLAIPLAYSVARRMAGRREALIASTLVATTPILILFSVCARGYTMLIDLFLVALLCGYDIIATRSTRPWRLFAVACAAGFFTIPVFLYPYGALMAWLFLAGRRDVENPALRVPVLIRSAAWTLALAAVCYAPAAATTGLGSGAGYAARPMPAQFLGYLPHILSSTEGSLMRGLPSALVVVLAASAFVGAVRLWLTPAGWVLLGPLTLFPTALVLMQRAVAPGRAWTYLLPVFFLYCAAGADMSAEWIGARAPRTTPTFATAAAATFSLAIVVSTLIHMPSHYTEWNMRQEIMGPADMDQVARYLKTTLTPRDALVLAFPLDYPMEYYLRVNDVPLDPFKRPPSHPQRFVVLANETSGETVERVLSAKKLTQTMAPKLLRRFLYSSLYEVQPYTSAQ